MSNLDYELMLEECVEGTFFERGPSGVVKKNNENSDNKNRESEKERFKKIMKRTVVVGVTGVALFTMVKKAVDRYVYEADMRAYQDAIKTQEEATKNKIRETDRKNEEHELELERARKNAEAYKREYDTIKNNRDRAQRQVKSKMQKLEAEMISNAHLNSQLKDPAGSNQRFDDAKREYEQLTKEIIRIGEQFAVEKDRLDQKYKL